MTIIWNHQIHTFILHNSARTDRLDSLKTWVKQLNTNSVHIIKNLDLPNLNNTQKGAFGIAHIIQSALQGNQIFKNNQKILILEDDVKPYTDINYINQLLKDGIEVPDDTDALYLGCSHFRAHSTEDTHEIGPSYTKINNKISRIWNMLGTHAILINTEQFAQNYLYSVLTSIASDKQYDIAFARTLSHFQVYALNKPAFIQSASVGGQEHQTMLELEHHKELHEIPKKQSFIHHLFQNLEHETIKTVSLQNIVFVPIDAKNIHHATTIASIYHQVYNQKIPNLNFFLLTTFNILDPDFLSLIQLILPSGYSQSLREWLFQNTVYIPMNQENAPAWKEFLQIYVHAHSSPIENIQSHFMKLYMVHHYLFHHENDISNTQGFTILNPIWTFKELPIQFVSSEILTEQYIFCSPSHSPYILQKMNKTGLHRITEIIASCYMDNNIKQHIVDIRKEMEGRSEQGGVDLFTFFQWIQQNAWNFADNFNIQKVEIPNIPNTCINSIEEARHFILGQKEEIPQITHANPNTHISEQPIEVNHELVDPIIIRPHFLGGKHTDIDRIYILQCLESIKFFHQHPNQQIQCLVNDKKQLINNGASQTKWFNHLVGHIENFEKYESPEFKQFLKNYIHLSTNHELFEKYSIASYFLIRETMRQNSWERAWIIETDTILLHSLADAQAIIQTPQQGTAYLTNNCTCCVAWVTAEAIEKYCNVITESYTNDFIKQSMIDIYLDMRANKKQGGINDMTFWDWMNRDCWGLNKGIQIKNIDIKLSDGSFFDYMIQETSKDYLEKRGFIGQQFKSNSHKAYIQQEVRDFETKKLYIKHGKVWSEFANQDEVCLIRSLQFQGHYKWLMIALWNSIRQKIGIHTPPPYNDQQYKLLPVQL